MSYTFKTIISFFLKEIEEKFVHTLCIVFFKGFFMLLDDMKQDHKKKELKMNYNLNNCTEKFYIFF